MAGRILQDDIEALKRRVDIADIVGDHTRLKRAGSRMKGLCPFHGERTPSFTVDVAEGVYHCFGCGAGGDVFTFLQQIEGLNFVESVEAVARRVGYELRYEEMSAGQRRALGERSRLVAANEAAAEWFHEQLLGPGGEVARTYLKERGFGREEAERFRIGLAPLAWEDLTRHLLTQRFTERDLEQAGLAMRNARGRMRDRFRGRLMFPILDLKGDVIGFGGRVLPDLDYGEHDPPKYLNTAETPIYRKSQVLYGMSWARPEIVRTQEVLIAEGYTDVVALHQAGFTNAVATCGTAVGSDHVRTLERYVERVVLAFDADAAGEKAAERALELARDHEVELRILVMPPGRDPADVVRAQGVEAMRTLVHDAEPVLRFLLRRIANRHPSTLEGRSAAAEEMAPLLAAVSSPVERDQYVRLAADILGIGLPVVAAAVEAAGGSLPAIDARVTEPTPMTLDRRELSVRAQIEREVLRTAIQRPGLLPDAWSDVSEDDLTHPKAKAVLRAIVDAGGPGADLATILDHAADDELRGLIRAIALEEFHVEPDEAKAAMSVARLLLYRLDGQIAQRKADLERINRSADPDGHDAALRALFELEARRRDLMETATG